MDINTLLAISPIDGRYRNKLKPLEYYFSEFALIKYRVEIEIKYLIFLTNTIGKNVDSLSTTTIEKLSSIYLEFSIEDGVRVKEIENTTNHDVKAVEYFIKEKVKAFGCVINMEFVHFGLTSQDINNTAIPLSIKRYMYEIYLPELERLIENIDKMADAWKSVPMLAKTHGQPASPTTLGKEMKVF